jgi:hypothetical protein
LGCITLDSSWYNLLYRPINFMPMDRSVVNTTFVLRTREAPTTVTAQFIDSQHKSVTKFVVHGFLSTGDENWYTVSCITELQVE